LFDRPDQRIVCGSTRGTSTNSHGAASDLTQPLQGTRLTQPPKRSSAPPLDFGTLHQPPAAITTNRSDSGSSPCSRRPQSHRLTSSISTDDRTYFGCGLPPCPSRCRPPVPGPWRMP
jgi:hypothetical protein